LFGSRSFSLHAREQHFGFLSLGYLNGLLRGKLLAVQEAKTYAQENGLFFMETSAKTAANVNDVFYEIGGHKILSFILLLSASKRRKVHSLLLQISNHYFFVGTSDFSEEIAPGTAVPEPAGRDGPLAETN
jgi:hypothetical protein